MDTIIIDELPISFDSSQLNRLCQIIEAEKAIRREAVMVAQFIPCNGAQVGFFEIDGKPINPGTQVTVTFGPGHPRNGVYIAKIVDQTPKCTIVDNQDDPKLRALYAQLSRAKMQRNKHLITDLEKRIKNYVRH